MSNQEKLQNYLLGDEKKEGYLKSKLSNGKVIMLSGKWGSGKTHFWQNKIVPTLNKEKNKIPNHYISLYGKTSIDEIKNEIFIKIFESVDSFESTEKALDMTKKSAKLLSMFSSSINVLGVNLNLSKVTDKTFNGLENLLEDKKLKKTEEYLNSGAIICFDDFERKSNEIDLNDLFGFITQLTLNFKCKVVIILNDDVFEDKEKTIFSNVKEKSVSKFLYYNPTIGELFDSIFNEEIKKYKKYAELNEYRDLIIETIKETEELNARIYIQILYNLFEWIQKASIEEKAEIYLKYLILLNINFIINHEVIDLRLDYINDREKECKFIIKKDELKKIVEVEKIIKKLDDLKISYNKDFPILSELENIKKRLSDNEIKSIYFTYLLANFKRPNMDESIIEKINQFIKTGIL